MAVGRAGKPIALTLLPYLRYAWWRKQKKAGVWSGANQTMITMLTGLGTVGVLIGCVFAWKSLHTGQVDRGLVALEFCLNMSLLGWLFIPSMVGTTSAEGRGLQPVRLGQYPLRLGDLLAIGLLGNLIQPVYWLLAAGSLCVLLPLAMTAQAAPGLVAGVLFILLSGSLAFSIELFGGALFSSRHGREVLLSVALILFAGAVVLINGDFALDDGAVTYGLGGRQWLLLSADGTGGLMAQMRVFSPARWVTGVARAGDGPGGLLWLGLAVTASAVLAVVSLRRVMLHPPHSLTGKKGRSKAIGQVRGLSRVVGPLVIKELRYLTRTLDFMMGMGMAVAAVIWIVVRPGHMHIVLPLAAMNIVFNESAIPLNIFGLDGVGTDRYRLLPLSGRQVLLTKNLAYFAMVALQLVPLVLVGVVRGGGMLALVTVLATFAVCLVTAVGGNLASVSAPSPRAFFNFDSKEQAGGGLSLLLAALVWVVPTLTYFVLLHLGLAVVALAMTGLLVIAFLVYRGLLSRGGQRFDEGAEAMRAALGKA